jgi:selenide,water dikinase
VTGFGLLGHLRNIVAASRVGARVYFDRVPVLAAAREYVQAGISPGGTHANHKFLSDWVSYADDVTKEEQLILCDAQTSGGLLAAVAPEQAEAVVASLRARGVADAVAIGKIESANPGQIVVTRTA